MATNKQFLTDYLLKSPVSGKNYHLVGSSFEVAIDKFNIFAFPNCWLWLSSTRQSEIFHSSSHLPNNLSTHRGIVEFCNSWCGSYYILVREWLSCIQMTHCKITTQLSQTMLGTACYYRDYVQCQIRNWETWHTYFHIQRAQDRILFFQQWRIWFLVFPWRHQVLSEWQYEKLCGVLVYSAQHMAGEDKYQCIKRGGCDIWKCWILNTVEGGIILSS